MLIKNKIINFRYTPIFLLLLLYLFLIFQDFNTINKDGVIYLTQAEILNEKNIYDAFQIYPQILYSVLILLVKKLFFVSTYISALIVNSILYFIFIFYFLKISELIIENSTRVRFASFFIIISSIPLLDNYVSMIIRDHGMWACFTAGMFFHIKYLKNLSYKNIFLGQAFYFLGSLFRIELIILYIISPLISFLINKKNISNILKYFFIVYFLFILAAFFLLIFNIFYGISFDFLTNKSNIFYRLKNILFYLKDIEVFGNNSNLNHILSSYQNHISLLLVNYVFLLKFISGIGITCVPLYFFILNIYILERSVRIFLFTTLIISLSVVYVNFLTDFVLTTRYLISTFIVLYIFSVCGFENYFRNFFNFNLSRNKIFHFFIFILFIINFLFIIIDTKKSNIEKISGNWINANLDINELIFFESARIAFYSEYDLKKLVTYEYLHNKNFDLSEYLEDYSPKYVVLNHENKLVLNCCDYQKIKTFTSDDKKKNVIIYENLLNLEN
jgi:hypothetical protein